MEIILTVGLETLPLYNPTEWPTKCDSWEWFNGAREFSDRNARGAQADFYAKLTNHTWSIKPKLTLSSQAQD